MTGTRRRLQVESTGDEHLDTILGGGIPTQSSIVIAGSPGSGKTVFVLQTLFHAARRRKRALYFTALSEPAIKVIRYMQLFDFFDQELLEKYIILADLGSAVRQGAEGTVAELTRMVEEHQPELLAIDSFRSIVDLMPDARTSRALVYDLATRAATWGTTLLLAGEYTLEEMPRYSEFVIADGIVRLGVRRQELTSIRELEVLKLRGMNYVPGQPFLDISEAGVSVYPRVRAPKADELRESVQPARVPTGVPGLDALFGGGGVPSASSTVVQGATGAGKTIVSLHFLVEGARRGENGILFTLEETPDQLRDLATSFGWDLARFERDGVLTIDYASPVELSTDAYLQTLRNQVAGRGVKRVVLDSLTSLALGVPSVRRFKELVYAVTKHMRTSGVTLFMTMEAEQLLGAETLSGHGVSFIADNLIRMRYIEAEGRLDRGISVLKSRGVRHETELRRLEIAASGARVGTETFADRRGAPTGRKTTRRRKA